MSEILHIFNYEEKFSKPFFQFLQDNDFDLKKHSLFHYGINNPEYKKFSIDFTFAKYYSGFKHLFLLKKMFKAQKIIVHSLASPWLLLFLFLFPKLTSKVYWVIWGKDLYFYKLLKNKRFYHRIYEFFRKRVFKNIKHVVTCVPGDAGLAKDWYKVNAQIHNCLMYPSNLFHEQPTLKIKHHTIKILLGNSADPSNNHIEILKKLLPFKHNDIKIFVPLSYGNKKHAHFVFHEGRNMFGNKFIPLMNFIKYDKYIALLNEIDIAIFGHKRQQAMGNTINLLGMGKKIYMDNSTSSWGLFKKIGVKVYDNKNISIERISNMYQNTNKRIISNYFSIENLKNQLKELLE